MADWPRKVWILCGFACLLLQTNPALAALAREDYVLQTFQIEQGLPQNSVTDLLQGGNGYIWLATYNGLARFDGTRFVVLDAINTPALASSRITKILEDREGWLWIGHEGGEVTRGRDGHFEAVSLGKNWPAGPIRGIQLDQRGDVWILSENGLVIRTRDGSRMPPEPLTQASPLLSRDHDGVLWRVQGGKCRRVSDTPRDRELPQPFDEQTYLQCMAPRRAGGLWGVTGRSLLWEGKPGSGESGSKEGMPWEGDSVTALLESMTGDLWVGTLSRGLFVLGPAGDWIRLHRGDGLSHDWVRCLHQDREGTVWAGTGAGGLCALYEARVRMVVPPDQFHGSAVLSVAADEDGSVWVGTEGAGIYHLNGTRIERFSQEQGLSNPFVWSVLPGGVDGLLAGTWGAGVFRRSGGTLTQMPAWVPDTGIVMASLRARDGTLWFGTRQGLLRVANGRSEPIAGPLLSPEVRTIAEDAGGTLWFGMSGGGLGRWTHGAVSQFLRRDGLPSDHVWTLLPREDGSLWIGTAGGGLCRLKSGKFESVTAAQGLPNNTLCHLADDGRGRLWISSYGGILSADWRALEDCMEGRAASVPFRVHGRADGLISLECSGGLQPAGCRTPDGRLWFANSRGIAVVDPSRVGTNTLPPDVHIEEIRTEGHSWKAGAGKAGAGFESPPGFVGLEFHFTATTFIAPDRVRFRYRLEGLEEAWREGGMPRSATYLRVPPGQYRFHVTAANADGIWNVLGDSVDIVVPPLFWQTWWFSAVAAITALGGTGAWVRWLMRRRYQIKLEAVNRQRAVERERTRIARDIHDDLGASLTRISLLSQSARGDLEDRPSAARHVDQIQSTALELTHAMDEIVWAVDPKNDTLDSLASYLGGYTEDLLHGSGIRCRLDVPMNLPDLPVSSNVRHNVFLALKESLHNVIKHSAATEAGIRISLDARNLTLEIHDNGRGFNPGDAADKGNGLANLKGRMENVGGSLGIDTCLGGGTRVRLTVPLRSSPDRGLS